MNNYTETCVASLAHEHQLNFKQHDQKVVHVEILVEQKLYCKTESVVMNRRVVSFRIAEISKNSSLGPTDASRPMFRAEWLIR